MGLARDDCSVVLNPIDPSRHKSMKSGRALAPQAPDGHNLTAHVTFRHGLTANLSSQVVSRPVFNLWRS